MFCEFFLFFFKKKKKFEGPMNPGLYMHFLYVDRMRTVNDKNMVSIVHVTIILMIFIFIAMDCYL